MSDELYRDAHLGMRARLGELEARIVEREAEVTPAFWATVPESLREQLGSLREGRELAASDSLDELVRAEGMLSTYLEELERLIAKLPALEEEWMEVPATVADPPAPTSVYGIVNFDEAQQVLVKLTTIVREHARDAVIETEAPTFIARFTERGAPFALTATMYPNGNGIVEEVGMWLVTSIPRALPPLVVRHESLVLNIGKALGLRHEIEVGEPSFDGLFLIEGEKEAADLFLVPAVRANLMALSRYDVPTLEVDPKARVASVRWRFEPAAKAIDAAVRILTWIRSVPPSVRFRNA